MSKIEKSWLRRGFFERAVIVRDYIERRESPEYKAICAALREVRREREEKAAKMEKLRAFLLSKRTKVFPPNIRDQV